jgi:orotidine-5'-phosphate decarboxylase
MINVPNFADRLYQAIKDKKSFLCGGLDPQLCYMPPTLIRRIVDKYGRNIGAVGQLIFEFNKLIIDAICDYVVCVKPNMAFYEIYGHDGVWAYEETIRYAHEKGLLVVGDVKRGDGGDTANAYAAGYLGEVPFFGVNEHTILPQIISPVRVDCATIHAYIGEACVAPFVDVVKKTGNGIFVVTKTSFKPNSEIEQLSTVRDFQQVVVGAEPCLSVWERVAEMVQRLGEGTEGACGLRNVGVVMGGTYPKDMPLMRNILPDSIFLIPGFGGQGATADDVVVGIREDGLGGIVNNSRNLIYAWQNKKGNHQCEPKKFAEAARLQAIDDRDALVAACRKAGKWPF